MIEVGLKMILPIGIIVLLGGCCGLFVRRWISNNWISTLCGAGIATVLWVSGVYLMFWFTAPAEGTGLPLFTPILLTFLTALASAAATLWFTAKREHCEQ